MIFPCFYNAPISWYSIFILNSEENSIEIFENYTKQTYRNRCQIYGANGALNLVIPVVKNHGKKSLIKDVKIDYDMSWHKNHWNSIVSAYSSAPFFEYIYDSYIPFYNKKFKYLCDFNLKLLDSTLDLLNLKIGYKTSLAFNREAHINSLSDSIHPKREFNHPDYIFTPEKYQQVFSEKFGFMEDLSILDLLFNEGPNASTILSRSLERKEKTK